jgi:hypothetical protein
MESKGKGKIDLEDDMDEEPMDEPGNENEEEAGDQGTIEEDKKLSNITTFMYINVNISLANCWKIIGLNVLIVRTLKRLSKH